MSIITRWTTDWAFGTYVIARCDDGLYYVHWDGLGWAGGYGSYRAAERVGSMGLTR